MKTKKANLLELSDAEKINAIKEAKTRLLKQVSEERFFRRFAKIYGINAHANSNQTTEQVFTKLVKYGYSDKVAETISRLYNPSKKS